MEQISVRMRHMTSSPDQTVPEFVDPLVQEYRRHLLHYTADLRKLGYDDATIARYAGGSLRDFIEMTRLS
jgi:hypothetical protein